MTREIKDKLYLVYLGGPMTKDRIGEDHEVVLVVAQGQMGAMSKGRAKWAGIGRGHVDRVVEIKNIDGFDIILKKQLENKDKLKECKNDYTK